MSTSNHRSASATGDSRSGTHPQSLSRLPSQENVLPQDPSQWDSAIDKHLDYYNYLYNVHIVIDNKLEPGDRDQQWEEGTLKHLHRIENDLTPKPAEYHKLLQRNPKGYTPQELDERKNLYNSIHRRAVAMNSDRIEMIKKRQRGTY